MRYTCVLLTMAPFALCAAAADLPVREQNAIVQKYCAVCHTDAAHNGGLSLEHFDAATASPSLFAMMLRKLNTGAMGAAGIPKPPKEVIEAFVAAVTAKSTGAVDWHVETSRDGVTASILRNATPAESYRLILSCKPAAREGVAQVAWAPEAHTGKLGVSVDGAAPVEYVVEGTESMGNGSGVVLNGPASAVVSVPLPRRSLTVGNLLPNEVVTFPFDNLPADARRTLESCFPPQ